HRKVRVGDDRLVARTHERQEREREPARGAAGYERIDARAFGDVPAQVKLEVRVDFAQKRRNALGERVAVLVLLDRLDRAAFDRRGHGEVGLTDREIDRIIQLGGEVENAPDAGRTDTPRTITDQTLGIHISFPTGIWKKLTSRRRASWE